MGVGYEVIRVEGLLHEGYMHEACGVSRSETGV